MSKLILICPKRMRNKILFMTEKD